MFKLVKKLIKWSAIGFVGLVGLGVYITATETPAETAAREAAAIERQAERDAKRAEQEAAEREAEFERQRKEEAKRIAEAAYRNSPAGKTEKFMNYQATGHCKEHTRNSAKFPTKVDFDWGIDRKFWLNFDEDGNARVMVQFTGEMMNGLGLMIPFTATCKYDYHPTTGKGNFVEFLL
jgi:hypothetical protein